MPLCVADAEVVEDYERSSLTDLPERDVNPIVSHAELEWTVPSIATFYVELSKRHRAIRYDRRGVGLSGEPPGGWGAATATGAQQGMSSREMGLDLSALAKALGLDRFALMGCERSGTCCHRIRRYPPSGNRTDPLQRDLGGRNESPVNCSYPKVTRWVAAAGAQRTPSASERLIAP